MATYPGICAEIDRVLSDSGRGGATRLATILGVSANTVSQWRARASSPEPDRWTAIEEALELYPGRLREVAGNPPVAADDKLLRRVDSLEARMERIENLLQAEKRRTARR